MTREGKVSMRGTPSEVFSHAEALQELGLDLPEAAHIALLLRRRGLDIPAEVYTVAQLRDAVLALASKGGPAAC